MLWLELNNGNDRDGRASRESFYYSRVKDVRRSSNRKDVKGMTSPT